MSLHEKLIGQPLRNAPTWIVTNAAPQEHEGLFTNDAQLGFDLLFKLKALSKSKAQGRAFFSGDIVEVCKE